MSQERAKKTDEAAAAAPPALRLWSEEPADESSNDAPTAPMRRMPAKRDRKPAKPAATSLDGLPLMLTVEESADVLRISRTTAYKLVELYRRTGGREGLPHVRLGGRVFVRRVDLAEIVGVPPDAA